LFINEKPVYSHTLTNLFGIYLSHIEGVYTAPPTAVCMFGNTLRIQCTNKKKIRVYHIFGSCSHIFGFCKETVFLSG